MRGQVLHGCCRVLALLLAFLESLGLVDPLVALLVGVARVGASAYSRRDLLLLMSRRCGVKSVKAIETALACGLLRMVEGGDGQSLLAPTEMLLPLAQAYDLVLDELPECRRLYREALRTYRRAILAGRRRLLRKK